jgi:drug/metabolite transporter (DMT)-like permease
VSGAVFVAAIVSALLHACWNMLAKSRSAPPEIIAGIVLATASFCILALPVVGIPATKEWPWIGAASASNVIYLRVLTRAYANSEFSTVYAVVRAVILPTLFILGWLFLTEPGRLSAFVGLAFVVSSILLYATRKNEINRLYSRTMALSVLAGLLLALSLFFDVNGIRAGGVDAINLIRYSVASSLTTASALSLLLILNRQNPIRPLKDNAKQCYIGAALLLLSYLCGMWAYAQGPIGLVAPLRESGILVSGVLAVLVLRERITELQWVAMGLATIGVLLIQIG